MILPHMTIPSYPVAHIAMAIEALLGLFMRRTLKYQIYIWLVLDTSILMTMINRLENASPSGAEPSEVLVVDSSTGLLLLAFSALPSKAIVF